MLTIFHFVVNHFPKHIEHRHIRQTSFETTSFNLCHHGMKINFLERGEPQWNFSLLYIFSQSLNDNYNAVVSRQCFACSCIQVLAGNPNIQYTLTKVKHAEPTAWSLKLYAIAAPLSLPQCGVWAWAACLFSLSNVSHPSAQPHCHTVSQHWQESHSAWSWMLRTETLTTSIRDEPCL